ncbi:MAG TPA: serine hydrolase domain-containing protein [Longimicrobium sp.]|nr:serine hydrolase domain-containing protein [Longimicrobium sp.]
MLRKTIFLPLLSAALLATAADAQPSASAAAPAPAPVRRSDAETAQLLDGQLSRMVPFGFSGSILVARDGRVLLEKGYGLADRAAGTPVTAQTVFDIGSITKQFTAAAILKLEEAGKLRVTDPVSRHLPGVPADKASMTLHHLLTHSAGLEDVFGGDYEVAERDSLVQVALNSKLLWAPGTRYRYSNVGYTLLAAIVERHSGQPYERFLRETFFVPAGMERTGYLLPGWRPGEQAHGYRRNGEVFGTPAGQKWAPDGPWWNLRGNGGILSNVGDLYRWNRALEGSRILTDSSKRKLFAPHMPENPEATSHYGYGWSVTNTTRGTKLVSHNGGNGVFFADFRRYVDEGVTILVMSNVSGLSAAWAVVPRIVFGTEYVPAPATAPLSPAAAAALAGTYRLPSGTVLTAAAAGGEVTITASAGDALAALTGMRADAVTDSFAKRTKALLDGLTRDDYTAAHQAYGGRRTLEDVTQSFRREAAEFAKEYGELRGYRVLGAARDGGRVEVLAVGDYARGPRYETWIWIDGQVRGLQTAALPSARFLPAAGGGWVAYDVRTGRMARVRAEGRDLVFVLPDGEVRARREG